jgi:hypothetical protein
MAAASTLQIQEALDTQLQTVVGLPAFYPENATVQQNSNAAFCRSTLAQAKSEVATLGAGGIWTQQGLYAVDLFFPTAYGYSALRTAADAVIAAFPTGFLTLTSGQKLQIISAWSLPGSADQGAFLMVPVRVQWVIRS